MAGEDTASTPRSDRTILSLPIVLEDWFKQPSFSKERLYLETHPEIFDYRYESLLQNIIDMSYDDMLRLHKEHIHSQEQAKKIQQVIREYLKLLHDIRLRGSTISAIREAYVNAYGGLVLDMPVWLQEAEPEILHFSEQARSVGSKSSYRTYIHDIIERAKRDSGIARETLAELYIHLQYVITGGEEMPAVDILEEKLSHLHQAFSVYSRERYPLQYAKLQAILGGVYQESFFAKVPSSLEKAITCYQDALAIFTQEDHPERYVTLQINLGNIYSQLFLQKIRETDPNNLHKTITHYNNALAVLTPTNGPVHYAMIVINLNNTSGELSSQKVPEPLDKGMAYYKRALFLSARWETEAGLST